MIVKKYLILELDFDVIFFSEMKISVCSTDTDVYFFMKPDQYGNVIVRTNVRWNDLDH